MARLQQISRTIALVIFLSLTSDSLAQPAPDEAYWPGVFPTPVLHIYLTSFADTPSIGTSTSILAAMRNAAFTWFEQGQAHVRFLGGEVTGSGTALNSEDGRNVLEARESICGELCEANGVSPMALATTISRWVPGTGETQLAEVDVIFWKGATAFSTNPGKKEHDLESIALHELGHALGLKHRSLPESVMYEEIAPGKSKRSLHPNDIAHLQSLYGMRDSVQGSQACAGLSDARYCAPELLAFPSWLTQSLNDILICESGVVADAFTCQGACTKSWIAEDWCCGDEYCAPQESCSTCPYDCGTCGTGTCSDGLKNQGETEVDCGGPCPPCPDKCPFGNGKYCGDPAKGQDANRLYECTNGVWNSGESCPNGCDLKKPGTPDECYPFCGDGKCASGETCDLCPGDCGACSVATCSDGLKNGDEVGVDCGGSCGPCVGYELASIHPCATMVGPDANGNYDCAESTTTFAEGVDIWVLVDLLDVTVPFQCRADFYRDGKLQFSDLHFWNNPGPIGWAESQFRPMVSNAAPGLWTVELLIKTYDPSSAYKVLGSTSFTVVGACVPSCSAASCEQSDGCGGTCPACECPKDDFCVVHGYASGSYCDGSYNVKCNYDGACPYEEDGKSCTEGCENGECVNCASHDTIACISGKLYWMDSCGSVEDLFDSCDDANECTTDSCNDTGCTNTPVTDGTPCGSSGACKAGQCDSTSPCACTPVKVEACTNAFGLGIRTCGADCAWGACETGPAVVYSKMDKLIYIKPSAFFTHGGVPLANLLQAGNLCAQWFAAGATFNNQQVQLIDYDGDGWVTLTVSGLGIDPTPYPGCSSCTQKLPARFTLKECVGDGWAKLGDPGDPRTGDFLWSGADDQCDCVSSLAISFSTSTWDYYPSGSSTSWECLPTQLCGP